MNREASCEMKDRTAFNAWISLSPRGKGFFYCGKGSGNPGLKEDCGPGEGIGKTEGSCNSNIHRTDENGSKGIELSLSS